MRAASGQPAERLGEQRGEGQPEAGPLPGQPDLSRPQVTLPPDLEELLDSLTPEQEQQLPLDPGELEGLTPEELQNRLGQVLPQVAPPGAPDSTGQLLDFLLAP